LNVCTGGYPHRKARSVGCFRHSELSHRCVRTRLPEGHHLLSTLYSTALFLPCLLDSDPLTACN
jgi:tRNA A-37 threonylcarbamoyl transferase component Bud32